MKVTIVGAGSTYTPELVDGLLRRRTELPLRTLGLVDPNRHRLDVVGGFVRRMCERAGAQITVTSTSDLEAGVQDAAFVFSQFRIGGQAARHADEMLGRRWGLVGQETTGVGGFAKGLRTIPAALDVQRAVAAEGRSDAWLINFTNPAGMVTEALLTHGAQAASGGPPRVIGLCNFPWILRVQLGTALGVEPGQVDLDYAGLNHLSWVRGVTVGGMDRSGEAVAAWRSGPDAPFAEQLLDDVGGILNPYLQYYYETSRAVERQHAEPTRAAAVAAIEAELLRRYDDPDATYSADLLARRGGALYSEAAAALAADLAGAPSEARAALHVLNVLNDGTLPGLPDDAVIETTCAVGTDGAVPRRTTALEAPARGLANAVKDYERYAIEAAVTGDLRAARLALLVHPLCPDGAAIPALLDDVLRTNRPFLPQFG